ncbi:MAG TPA: cyclic nucleotide-binding domain-containing protein, partial [Myxococcales bacterium]
MNNTQLLGQVSIFQELPARTIADLAKRVWHKQAEAGSVIVSQEDAGEALFVIAKGKVKVVLYGETGREIILSIMKAGDFFGEMSLLDRQPRSANVVALEDSELLCLDREAFQTHLAAHPTTALGILAEMSRRLR